MKIELILNSIEKPIALSYISLTIKEKVIISLGCSSHNNVPEAFIISFLLFLMTILMRVGTQFIVFLYPRKVFFVEKMQEHSCE